MAKLSTLIDEFTGSSLNLTLWTPSSSTGPTTQITVSGGNLNLGATPGHSTVTSTANYDWQNSEFVIQPVAGNMYMPISSAAWLVVAYGNASIYNPNTGTNYTTIAYNSTTMKYFKLVLGTTSLSFYYSTNNSTWTLIGNATTPIQTEYPVAIHAQDYSTATIGAVNPLPNQSPTVEVISPDDQAIVTTTNPVLTFKGTDSEAESITYQIQMSLYESFTTLLVDEFSSGGLGFSGTDPYASGTNVTYTVQSPLTLGGITYYWRVRAKDPAGTNTFGQWATSSIITEPFAPQVTSLSVANVSMNTVTASGNVTSDGGGLITERGIVYGATANPTTADGKQTALGTTGSYAAGLTGLTASTLYHWRAYATNSKATSYGSDQTFTTLPNTSTITSIHDIAYNQASVDVTFPSGDGAEITERGIVYSTVSTPTILGDKIIDTSGTASFTSVITNLTGTTKYYVRAYATNEQGTSYSPQVDFTTEQQPATPTVITGQAANIGEISADFNDSSVTLDGTQPVTERGVVFSSTENDPSITDNKVIAGSAGLGSFDVSLENLQPETLYYARAYAVNSIGVGYGTVQTFTTLALFIPDAGDGYWTWRPEGSDAMVARSQATPADSSANLLLSDLTLEDGAQYTLYHSSVVTDNGDAYMILQWYDNLVKYEQFITPGIPYTFTYDKSKLSWAIRLYITSAQPEPDNINAIFSDMYLAKESTFSGFVPFVAKGLTEIKIENNWLLDKDRENGAQIIFDEVYGMGWYQFTTDTIGLGWLEIGDQFTIQTVDGPSKVIVWDTSFTVDGGISETLSAESPKKTETDYSKAGQTTKSIKRTQISVDHNQQQIESIVEDVYSDNGVINTKFTKIEQDLDAVTTTVQSAGGVNLVKNSVMYSFSDDGVPDNWTVAGTGVLTIQASPESLSGGGISGNIFALNNETVTQANVTVRKDVDFVAEADKLYYSFSARVKKNTVGNATITLSNRNESHVIELPDQREYYWEAVSLEGLLPLDDHYSISIYSDADANLQVTDVMLSPGKNIRQWTQFNGETMNTNVAINSDGMTIRSNVFRNDYVRIDALGFEVHKHEAGGERVFGFNGDETNVRKLKADAQISLAPIRMVPINYGTYKGTAFTRTEDN